MNVLLLLLVNVVLFLVNGLLLLLANLAYAFSCCEFSSPSLSGGGALIASKCGASTADELFAPSAC